MKSLLFDICLDRRHAAQAFLRHADGAYTTDWLAPNAPDTDIIDLARRLDRIVLTEDADFGDLVFRDYLPPPPGIILVMTQLIPRAERAARLDALAPHALDVAAGHFVVVGPTRCRFRPLPHATPP